MNIRHRMRHFTGAVLLAVKCYGAFDTIVQAFIFYQITRVFAVKSIHYRFVEFVIIVRFYRHQTARGFASPNIIRAVRNDVNIGKFCFINCSHVRLSFRKIYLNEHFIRGFIKFALSVALKSYPQAKGRK